MQTNFFSGKLSLVKNILIIGAGNMGGAIFRALAASKFSRQVFVVDSDFQKLENLNSQISKKTGADFSANFFTDLNEISSRCKIVILAIKPQSLTNFSADFNGKILISILAGTAISTLQKKFPTARIVRAMPNLSAAVGKSLTGFFAENLPAADRKLVEQILQTFGETADLQNENEIDALTAVAGSGPAYFFLLGEILQKVAESFGFEKNLAEKLARQTFFGAAKFAENSPESFSNLREKVTSPGGTTAAALEILSEKKWAEIFRAAVEAAKKRAAEIAKSS